MFQRTPSSVDVRDNHPTDPEWFAEIATPGWQQRWLENFTANQTGGMIADGGPGDGRLDRHRPPHPQPDHGAAARRSSRPRGMMAAFEDSDFEKMEEIRARVDAIVEDPTTAQNLKAWYRQLCKRPCFHDEYLQAYNEPGTHLVDTDGKGVERITENGVVVGGVEYEVDCIIYASGFEVGTEHTRRMGYDVERPRRRAAVGVLGRRHAHQARHPRARLPEPVHRAADAGRQPHLERAPQPHRGGQDDRR